MRARRPSAPPKDTQERSQGKLLALGNTVLYAVGNILLAAWGRSSVALMR